jgi:hypothetical protein
MSPAAGNTNLAPGPVVGGPDAARSPGDAPDAAAPCELVVASGEPPRHLDKVYVVMRLSGGCDKSGTRLRWYANHDEVGVARVERLHGDTFYLLRLGRLERERLTITVTRAGPGAGTLATAATETRAAPVPIAALSIPGQGGIEFIPNNREARVILLGEEESLILLPVAGVYRVRRDGAGSYVQGESMASGPVSLRFGVRAKGLPAGLADVDLAIVHEKVVRSIRECDNPLGLELEASAAGAGCAGADTSLGARSENDLPPAP